MNLDQALDIARESRSQAEADYFEHLRIPSVSALSRPAGDCRRAAENLLGQFRRIGFEASLVEGEGHPTVRAEWLGAPGKPLLTIYGHYDVQPPDPVEQWTTPPFEPTVRDGVVYARGAADSKGNHFACLKAAEYAMAAGGPAVNLRFLVEGEGEGNSKVLPAFLEREAGELQHPPREARWAGTSLGVHGVIDGFTDEGPKTVIPARATAKISMRLVPDQDPAHVFATFAAFCESLATPGTRVKVREIGAPA